MSGRGQTRRAMDVDTGVVAATQDRLTGMNSHSHHETGSPRPLVGCGITLRLDRCRDREPHRGEHREHGVALT